VSCVNLRVGDSVSKIKQEEQACCNSSVRIWSYISRSSWINVTRNSSVRIWSYISRSPWFNISCCMILIQSCSLCIWVCLQWCVLLFLSDFLRKVICFCWIDIPFSDILISSTLDCCSIQKWIFVGVRDWSLIEIGVHVRGLGMGQCWGPY
jgi:hypothetical protein